MRGVARTWLDERIGEGFARPDVAGGGGAGGREVPCAGVGESVECVADQILNHPAIIIMPRTSGKDA